MSKNPTQKVAQVCKHKLLEDFSNSILFYLQVTNFIYVHYNFILIDHSPLAYPVLEARRWHDTTLSGSKAATLRAGQ